MRSGWFAGCAIALAVGGGCSSRGTDSAILPKQVGYVNLNALVKQNPGWAAVTKCADSGRVLDSLQRNIVQPGATAPYVLAGKAGAVVFPVPRGVLNERIRLSALITQQLGRFATRRQDARDQRITHDQGDWARTAEANSITDQNSALLTYRNEFDVIVRATSVRRLNLKLQVFSLKKLIADWSKSSPPSPKLNAARVLLIKAESDLLRLSDEKNTKLLTLAKQRDGTLVAARDSVPSFIATKTVEERTRLQSQDAHDLRLYNVQLSKEATSILNDGQSLWKSTESQEPLAAISVPPTQGVEVRLPGQSVMNAKLRIASEEQRWRTFLYSETRTEALDLAKLENWKLNFVPSAGEPDLTKRVGELLSRRVWNNS